MYIANASSELNYYINKHAGIMDWIMDFLWDSAKGPMENIFGWISMAAMFIPTYGWAVSIIAEVADLFGYGPRALGGVIDKAMGWKSFSDISFSGIMKAIERLITGTAKKEIPKEDFLDLIEASKSDNVIKKYATAGTPVARELMKSTEKNMNLTGDPERDKKELQTSVEKAIVDMSEDIAKKIGPLVKLFEDFHKDNKEKIKVK